MKLKIFTSIKAAALMLLLLCSASITKAQNCGAGWTYYATPGTTMVQFYDSSYANGTITNYSWSFGDNTVSTLPNPNHVYNSPGAYYVCETIASVNSLGVTCTSYWCDTVYVGGFTSSCNAAFGYNLGTAGLVYFNDNSTGNPTQWYWSFGDGSNSSQQNPTHTYAANGNYNVCLYIVTANCTDTACQTFYVQVTGSNCNAMFYAAPDSNTLNSFHFINQSTGGVNYYWNFGDGSTSTLFDPHHTYANAGTYQVCLYISDSATQCFDSYCYTVTVGGGFLCYASFSYVVDTTLGVYFTDMSANSTVVSWSWSFGDGTGSALQNPYHQYAQSGYYTVCLTITTATGCTNQYCSYVNVLSPNSCNANFVASLNGTPNTYHFTNLSSGGTQYYWNFGDGSWSSNFDPNHTFANPGTYLVCLTISDSMQTCNSTFCDSIVVGGGNPCIPVFYTYTDTLTDSTYFYVSNNCGFNYIIWSFGDSTIYATTGNPNTPYVHMYPDSGWYNVCVTVISATDTLTYCDSVYIANRPASAGVNTIESLIANLTVAPNPISNNSSVKFLLKKSSAVRIELYDLIGNKVKLIADEKHEKDLYNFNVNADDLKQGIYLMRLTTDYGIKTLKVNVIK